MPMSNSFSPSWHMPEQTSVSQMRWHSGHGPCGMPSKPSKSRKRRNRRSTGPCSTSMARRLAVYSDVLVPRGPVGKLGGKILGCRELVVLHDQQGHPRLSTTHRGDQHLTQGAPQVLHRYEQVTDLVHLDCLVVDREGMAAEFMFQLQAEGRRVVTLLRSNQYKDEGSFTDVGGWLPWRLDREGSVVCEVAPARFQLPRPKQPDQPLTVRVALIRDWRKLIVCEAATEAETDEGGRWKADLAPEQQQFWEPEWQATPALPAPTRPKLIPVVTTAGKPMRWSYPKRTSGDGL